MKFIARLLLATTVLTGGAFGAGEIVVGEGITMERVIGSEQPGAYKHPATITELDNGDLYIAYYGGSGEYEEDTMCWGLRKEKGSDTWSEPIPLANTPFLGEGNPVIWQAPDGRVWLFYNQRYGDTWTEARVKGKVSTDGAKTWSDSFMLTFKMGMMVQGLPTPLENGTFLLPAYLETGHSRDGTAADTASLFFLVDPKTNTWKESGTIVSDKGNLQPQAVQLTEKHIIAYCRRGGTFDPWPDGRIIRAESHDGGMTWTKGEPSQFKNPNAAISFIKLRNDDLLMVYNDSIAERNPLTVSISMDSDKTWPYKFNIAESDLSQTFAYPSAMQSKDGKIHVVCTSNVRKTINHFTFDEKVILEHAAEK
jgi:predicted neuraminidase